jgi:hypothetical protein
LEIEEEMMKRKITSLMLATVLSLGVAITPTKKAHGGVLIMTASAVYAPIVIGVIGQFVGFGISVTSIYWTIENLDRAWLGYGLFMLDEQINTTRTQELIAQNYPDLDGYLVKEIAHAVEAKANLVEMRPEGHKEVVLEEGDIAHVLEIVGLTKPDLAEKLKIDLTTRILN